MPKSYLCNYTKSACINISSKEYFISGCKEYRPSVEEEGRYEFTGGHFLNKIVGFKTCYM